MESPGTDASLPTDTEPDLAALLAQAFEVQRKYRAFEAELITNPLLTFREMASVGSEVWKDFVQSLEVLDSAHRDHVCRVGDLIAENEIFDSREPSKIRDLFDSLERMYLVRREKDKAFGRLAPSDVNAVSRRSIESAARWSLLLDAAVAHASGQLCVFTGTTSGVALHMDDTALKADRILREAFALDPTAPVSAGWGGEGAVQDRRIGLNEVAQTMVHRPEAFADKGRRYYRGAIAEEARRDAAEQLQLDRDRLGLRYAPADEREDLNLRSLRDQEIEVAAAMMESISTEQALSAFRATLDGAALTLFDRIMKGDCESTTAACRELDLSQSTANDLRNRAARFAKRLAAEG